MKASKSRRSKYEPSIVSLVLGASLGAILWFIDNPQTRDPKIVFSMSIFLTLLIEIFISAKDIPENTNTLSRIDSEMSNVDKFVKNLSTDKKRVSEIEGHLFGREPFVRDFGFKIWYDYLDGFQITEGGIFLDGEEISIKAAIKLWRILSLKQLSNSEQRIVARITHSNDISIWLPEEREMSNDLYVYQQQFISAGGIIVRFLIGPNKVPDDRYNRAMKKMESIGIEVRYFYIGDVGERDFDFLYLHRESFVLKWYSGIQGKNLSGCFISDKREEEIINRWSTLFYKAKNEGNPITSIPKELEFFD